MILFKKFNKLNYIDSNAFQLISFLSILRKVMKAVIANKISYFVESQTFLSLNHYGVVKQKSSTNAFV